MLDIENQIECVIHEAFPLISFEEMQNWTMDKLLWNLSRAEWILANIRGAPISLDLSGGGNTSVS